MPVVPQKLIESLRGLDGFDEKAFLEIHEQEQRITSVRLNPFKTVELDLQLNEKVPWSQNSFYLNERPAFYLDPLFHAGCYYVQEAGSIFLEHALRSVLDLSKDICALDLCASPGGKSTLVNSLLTSNSVLLANETVKNRANTLVQNLSRWGCNNSFVSNSDPSVFSSLDEVFDLVIVDAPCSGSGLFRKQAEAVNEWSESNVEMCSARQKRIVADVLPALRSGGIIFYSTCSYSVSENEENVKWMMKEFDLEFVKVPVNSDWGIIESEFGYRFYPNLTKAEGFFCAILRKKGNFFVKNLNKSRKKGQKNNILIQNRGFFSENSGKSIQIGQFEHFLSNGAFDFFQELGAKFYLLKAGITLGEQKGKDFVPDQQLAWAHSSGKIGRFELDLENSLKFLRKQDLKLNSEQMGFSLLTYKDQGLGWVKFLGNRINNYLPAELRIIN
jgi:16S rRNA C967 or C1407 C5-methylase (RsmB/RsmF family)/NOL1/NOP2/fmu family ribosome biogenesis protein